MFEYLPGIAFEVLDKPQSISSGAVQHSFQQALAFQKGQLSEIVAIKLENIEREKHCPGVIPAAVKRIEIADAIRVDAGHLTVEHDGVDPQCKQSCGDLRVRSAQLKPPRVRSHTRPPTRRAMSRYPSCRP